MNALHEITPVFRDTVGRLCHVRFSPVSDLPVNAKDVRLLGLTEEIAGKPRMPKVTRAQLMAGLVPMRQNPHFTRRLRHITPVQSSREKYSSFAFSKIMIV